MAAPRKPMRDAAWVCRKESCHCGGSLYAGGTAERET